MGLFETYKMNKDKDDQEVSYDDGGGEPYVEELVKMEISSDDNNNNNNNNKVVAVVTEAQKNSSGEVVMHECNICFKNFKNGKALGGHRRSHFLVAKVKPHFSNLSKTSRTNNNNNKKVIVFNGDDSDGDNEGKHTCFLCKKDFPSTHSLYGHMRSHPERVWRGIYPPIYSDHKHNNNNNNNNKHSSSSSSLSYDLEDGCGEVAIDISKSYSFPRWKQTGKRGRKSTSVYDAAENLVFMSLSLRYSKPFATDEYSMVVKPKSPQSLKNNGEASTSENHAPMKTKFNVSDSLKLGIHNQNDGCDSYKVNRREGCLSELKDERVSLNMDYCEEGFEKDSGSINIKESIQNHSFDARKKMMKKVNNKKPKGQYSESEDKSFLSNETTQQKVHDYKCDNCLKSFPTFQGLGGHRSIHKRKKNNVLNMAESKSSDTIADDATLRGLVMEEDASSSHFRVPKILDFDLNMLPDEMLHD